MLDLAAALKFAIELAQYGGSVARKHYSPDIVVNPKDDNSPVTLADIEINKYVISRCKQNYPGIGVMGEEESTKGDSEYLWVCDPIDGTIPYVLGIRASTFCLALVKNGEPLLGVVYDIFNDRLYSAIKGEGAKVNGKPILMPEKLPLKFVNLETYPTAINVGDLRERLIDRGWQAPNFASAAFMSMSVLTGRIAGVVYTGTKPWDIAAVKVIAEECGCTVVNLDGAPQKYDSKLTGGIVAHPAFAKDIINWTTEARKQA
jgi:myo-inositol-1(or 4)-monophosphatase